MQTVKYSIRKLFQEGGATRRIGRRSNPAVPLEGAYIPVQLPSESKARVALIEDVFSDSPAFFLVMVKSKAFGIVPGTAVYNESNKLVSASVIWADGTPGEVGYQYTDANGSYVFSASKTTGSSAAKNAKEIVTKDGSGRDIGVIIGEEKGGAAVTLVAQPLPFTAKQNDPVSLTENTGLQMLTFSDLTAKVQIISEAYFEVSADGAAWSFFAEVDPLVSNNFYVRIKDTSILGALTGKLHFQVEGALAGECILTGHVGDGTEEYPYPIVTAAQLDGVRESLSAHYTQLGDIDLAGYDWVPIGQFGSDAFTGNYDGNGHTISSLTCETNGTDNAGLFGLLSGATVTDLVFTGAKVGAAGASAGVLVGYIDREGTEEGLTTISGVAVIDATVKGEGTLGGIAGYGEYFLVSACHVVGITIASAPTKAGGIMGYSSSGTISGCSASGSLSGAGTIGGITGCLEGVSIDNCRAACAVVGKGEASVCGGLIGEALGTGETIHFCVVTGSVSGTGTLGAIDGNADEAGTGLDPSGFTEIYFDNQTSITQTLNNIGEGMPTKDMKDVSKFSAFNPTLWVLVNGDYPKLRSEPDAQNGTA